MFRLILISLLFLGCTKPNQTLSPTQPSQEFVCTCENCTCNQECDETGVCPINKCQCVDCKCK